MAVQFKDTELEKTLEERANSELSAGLIAKRDLERYYWLLAQEPIELSTSEYKLCCDALNGLWTAEPWSIPLVWANIQDAIALEQLDTKWSVDGDALVNKISSATPAQQAGLIDRIERFWNKPGAQ